MRTPMSLRVILLATIVATVGCDRATKLLASEALAGTPGRSYLADSLRLSYAENPGGFLSLGAELPPAMRTAVFTVITGLVLLGLMVTLVRGRWSSWAAFGLTLFIAGGLSNWVNRALRGAVVDFMNIGIGQVRTGIFNVADVAMMAGVVVLIAAEWRRQASSWADTTS